MNEQVSIGEIIDGMSMDEILHHADFHQLRIFKGFGDSPDYWEVTFKSKVRSKNGWLSFRNHEVTSMYYCFYKIKD